MRCFYYAFRGIASAYRRERNMRIHSATAFYAVCAGFLCGIAPAEWLAVVICIAAVISLELLNTALEALCDEVAQGYSRYVRIAKDCAAGAVLVFAAASIVVGLVIFLKEENFAQGTEYIASNPWTWAAALVSLAFFIKIIFFTWRKTDDK
ncbi:MAG: diacylglycerol kinase family protein [Oscillospiraceae bacterium]